MDDLVYLNSPYHCLQNMPADHPYMSLYRRSDMFFCVGQGAWEDELLADTRKLDGVMHTKGIPAFVDYLGIRRSPRLELVAETSALFSGQDFVTVHRIYI
ncbi:MAG: hypothetical protein V8S38_06665 [Lachnospiraceae bacterium]